MKALVYFEANDLTSFEGVRMRKSIKGALEVSSVSHTAALLDVYDVAHFISPEDEIKIRSVIERKKPLIVSAFYAEDDRNASYFEYRVGFNKKTNIYLKSKSIKLLNEADIILVPNTSCRDLLVNQGITTEVRTMMPGINLSRFNFSRDDEKDIFNRYFRRITDKKMVVGFGDQINNIKAFTAFIKIAKALPNIDFYYISPSINERKLRRRALLHGIKCPKNCTTVNLMNDDLYRSALMNASMVIFPGFHTAGACSLADAMAAKCQIVLRKNNLIEPIVEDKVTALFGENDEQLVEITKKYFDNEIKPTIDAAYELISARTLDKFGAELIKIYNEQISLKN